MERTSYVLSLRMVFFYLVTTGWIFYIISLCEISINKKIKNNSTNKKGTSSVYNDPLSLLSDALVIYYIFA